VGAFAQQLALAPLLLTSVKARVVLSFLRFSLASQWWSSVELSHAIRAAAFQRHDIMPLSAGARRGWSFCQRQLDLHNSSWPRLSRIFDCIVIRFIHASGAAVFGLTTPDCESCGRELMAAHHERCRAIPFFYLSVFGFSALLLTITGILRNQQGLLLCSQMLGCGKAIGH